MCHHFLALAPSCYPQEAVPPALALPSLKQGLCRHSGDVVQANQVLYPPGVPCPVRLFFSLLAAFLFLPAGLLSLARSLITLAPMSKVLISYGFVVLFLSHLISFQPQVLTGMSGKERLHRNWQRHRREEQGLTAPQPPNLILPVYFAFTHFDITSPVSHHSCSLSLPLAHTRSASIPPSVPTNDLSFMLVSSLSVSVLSGTLLGLIDC